MNPQVIYLLISEDIQKAFSDLMPEWQLSSISWKNEHGEIRVSVSYTSGRARAGIICRVFRNESTNFSATYHLDNEEGRVMRSCAFNYYEDYKVVIGQAIERIKTFHELEK